MHTERQRAASHAHKLGDEAKRLEARCVELQRELEAQAKEAARLKVGCGWVDGWECGRVRKGGRAGVAGRCLRCFLPLSWMCTQAPALELSSPSTSPCCPCFHDQQEILKDARSANADMDDDALSSTRQVARLRHALEDSQGALKEAQATLAAERKRGDGARREAEAAGERAEEAARRCERLAGEAVELQAALEQKSELVAALQVGRSKGESSGS